MWKITTNGQRWSKQWALVDWMTFQRSHENHLGSFETCWILGHAPDQLSRTSGGEPQVWWFLRVPKWSPYAAMMKPLMHDSGALPSGLLRCFLQTYMNLRELEFRTLRMRSSFGKGHRIWHNLLLPVSKQACTMWLLWRTGWKQFTTPKESRFLDRLNSLSYYVVFPN